MTRSVLQSLKHPNPSSSFKCECITRKAEKGAHKIIKEESTKINIPYAIKLSSKVKHQGLQNLMMTTN